MSIDAMKQTFDFLHDLWEMKQTIRSDRHKKVMWELDRAIGKLEKQEPVAWMYEDSTYYAEGQLLKSYGFNTIKKWAEFNAAKGTGVVPLYTAPPLADIKDWEAVAADQAMTIAMMKDDLEEALKAKREWVGLTDEDYESAYESARRSFRRWNGTVRGQQITAADNFEWHLAYAIEAKLREKNAYGWQSVENPTEYLDELRGGDAT